VPSKVPSDSPAGCSPEPAEAAGGDRIVPKAEVGPDPTGIWALQNAWLCCGQGGHVVTTSIGHRGQLTLPAGAWSIMGRTHHSGQYGGANPMREIPRYVTLIERGLYDARALATTIVPWEQMLDAYMQAMERTTVASVITFG
jgi:S-(hydroxymethyl)glutathione dehydrogenase/alcohol dehydrogenase